MSSVLETIQQDVSLRFGALMALVFFALQIALVCVTPTFTGLRLYNFFLLSLIGIVAGCCGWASGIALSPIGSQVSGAQKILAGLTVFWTGVVAGHVPQISNAVMNWQRAQMNTALKIQMLFGFGIFLLATCVTFNTRFETTSAENAPVVPTGK